MASVDSPVMHTSPALSTPRPRCPQCLRAQRTCICDWIRTTLSEVEVLILQHPLEVYEAKGSGHLLHLSLPNSKIITGESFSPATLHALLYAPWNSTSRQAVLLYPHTPDVSPSPPLPAMANAQVRLVVLDATWRKSRKMLHANPLLQALPRLPLTDTPASRYHIRKAHQGDQLSTLEATCTALAAIENTPEKYQPLLQAFSGFVEEQYRYMTEGQSALPPA